MENSNEIFTILDFGTGEEMFNALMQLPSKYWKKLLSQNLKYDLLKKELFSSGDNLEKAKKKIRLLN